jgi:iron complex transport system ATP-binding protein
MLLAQNISYKVGKKSIVSDCSLVIQPGEFTAIVGPNGAGKTSLLRVLSHESTRYKGNVTFNGKNITKIKSRELSALRAVLPQHTTVNFPFAIEQIIEIGRYPHQTTRIENERIICEVLELTGLSSFRGRAYQTLSGGEQQRVQLARVITQIWDQADFPKYLLLDEPTSSMDMAHQHTLLELAKNLCNRNIGVLAILHDLNLAAQYADNVLFLKAGATVAQGSVRDVMTEEIIEKTFAHPVKVSYDEWTNKPVIYSLPKNRFTITEKQIVNKNKYVYE